jgi:hypothetical protein
MSHSQSSIEGSLSRCDAMQCEGDPKTLPANLIHAVHAPCLPYPALLAVSQRKERPRQPSPFASLAFSALGAQGFHSLL